MTHIPNRVLASVREHCNIPAHVKVCANMCRYDLLYGPAYARLPAAGVETITADDLATLYDDAEDACNDPGDVVVEVYASCIGDALRAFLDDLPSTLYVDDDDEFVSEHEPEGEFFDTGEVDDDGEPVMEWCEPSKYWQLDRKDIIEALFGQIIAREFN